MNVLPEFKPTQYAIQAPFVFAKDPLYFLHKGFTECGDTFRMKLLREFAATRSPAYFRHILQQNNKNYVKGYTSNTLALALGNGLLTSEGDFWLRQRRLIQPAFHKERLQELFLTMGEVTKSFLDELEESRGKASIAIDEKMMAITADIALKTMFSTITNENKSVIYHQMNRTQEHLIKRLRKPYLVPFMGLTGEKKQFYADLNFFNHFIYDVIKERKQSGVKNQDLLQLLLDSIDEETGEHMTYEQVRDEAITMFAAGHETSANGLNWLLLELSKHPAIVAKVRAESQIFNETPSFEQLMLMPYSRQVVEESLRLFPPAWTVVRELVNDDEIEGVSFKKGSTIFLSIFELHRNPSIWDNPLEFNPDNFSPENVKNRAKFNYLPFGAGPRFCIGQQFAMMEMQLILTSLLKRFSLEEDTTHTTKMFPLITLKPVNGVKMFVQ